MEKMYFGTILIYVAYTVAQVNKVNTIGYIHNEIQPSSQILFVSTLHSHHWCFNYVYICTGTIIMSACQYWTNVNISTNMTPMMTMNT